MVSQLVGSRGTATRQALEAAARKLFAERGFHATTIIDITGMAERSPAVFYRYFHDKQDLLAALAESFLDDVLIPFGSLVRLPESEQDTEPFDFMVTMYWDTFKPQIGVLAAVAQLSATQPRFADLQSRLRQFSIDVVAATVLRAQQQGYARELNPTNVAVALAAMFEQFTAEILRPDPAGLKLRISDEDAIDTLKILWKKVLYGYYRADDEIPQLRSAEGFQ